MKLDAIDLRILAELQRDASLSNVELARRIHLSPSPCLARVKALEAAGIISRYVALVDAPTLGLGLNVFIFGILGEFYQGAGR
ncbi:TPA: Lrp/AsnC family transcriptional regulator [Pseudomonas aeruginosa]|nr:Lrp/AsnC family transcriptional regulator [Pseudomonas aeruginosa]